MPTWLATVLLVGVTAVWGLTFVMVRDAIAVYGVIPFLALRFAIAGGTSVLLWGRRLSRATLVTGGAIGVVLAAGYLFQTWGLAHTTATNSGLITGLFVVLAPVADRLLYGTRLRPVAWVAVAVSLVGMTLLTGRLPTQLALGDLLTLGCAVAFGVHIALLSRHSPRHDPLALTAAQMLAVAVLFLLAWPAATWPVAPPREVWLALVVTGVFASTLAYLIQTAAQKRLSTARTAVILTLEPVFAGLFGFVLAGERLGPLAFLGAALIFGALLLVEAYPVLVRRRNLAHGHDGAPG